MPLHNPLHADICLYNDCPYQPSCRLKNPTLASLLRAQPLRNAHNTSSKSLPVIELRPYQEADLKWAQHVFYSTYLNLVPNGVILRLKSPLIWGFWIALWGFFNSSIDTVLRNWPVPEWVPLALRAFHLCVVCRCWSRTVLVGRQGRGDTEG
ncbi:hypothetical protein BC938DRAFT_470500 [Jimgerdemannia flammicorona]|uniref:Uncharacterized protein n=1 Tax=Jimgerdemannia flammicorona TaxID=994334 RepID=A0A433QA18_9FUNG|nr:hypothetical protein BC938DRAFT_470500 [Jimgerdemannia flammicorona]